MTYLTGSLAIIAVLEFFVILRLELRCKMLQDRVNTLLSAYFKRLGEITK